MLLPAERLAGQQTLWDWADDRELPSVDSARNYIGDYFEELIAVGMKGVRLTNDSNIRVCPDIHFKKKGVFGEVKSVGASKVPFLYKDRLEKYRDEFNGSIFHIFCFHGAKFGKRSIRVHALRKALAFYAWAIVVVPFEPLLKTIEEENIPLTMFPVKGGSGYGREEYAGRGGYRIPFRIISERFMSQAPSWLNSTVVYGHNTHRLPVFGGLFAHIDA